MFMNRIAKVGNISVAVNRGGAAHSAHSCGNSRSSASNRFPPLRACQRTPLWSRLFIQPMQRRIMIDKKFRKNSFRLPVSLPWLETFAFVILIMVSRGQY